MKEEEEDENVKSLQTDEQTDGETDDKRSEKLTCAFSPGELKAVNIRYINIKYWRLFSIR